MTIPVPWSIKHGHPIIALGLISIPVFEWAYSLKYLGIILIFWFASSWLIRYISNAKKPGYDQYISSTDEAAGSDS